MSKTDEFEEEVQKLVKKYKVQICYVASIIEDDDNETISFCGNMCFMCAKEALEKHIEIEGITHNTGVVH